MKLPFKNSRKSKRKVGLREMFIWTLLFMTGSLKILSSWIISPGPTCRFGLLSWHPLASPSSTSPFVKRANGVQMRKEKYFLSNFSKKKKINGNCFALICFQSIPCHSSRIHWWCKSRQTTRMKNSFLSSWEKNRTSKIETMELSRKVIMTLQA